MKNNLYDYLLTKLKTTGHNFLFLITLWLICGTQVLIAQNAKVTLKTPQMKIEDLIREIEKQTDYLFVFNKNEINLKKVVTVNSNTSTVSEILNQALTPNNIVYTVVGKNISLSVKASAKQPARTITGEVKDSSGEPIIGATVQVKGVASGTVTNIDGQFTLSNLSDQSQLQISYVGFHTQTVVVGGQNSLNIVLNEDTKALDEVVVTALGIKRESKALTYNVQELKSSDFVATKDASFMSGLAGKVAGVTINSSSSGIGGSTKVVMRGSKSISGNNNALYVVDGIPLPSLQTSQPGDLYTGMGQSGDGASMVNPDDIESISVLSGAAAAALYGSAAANGVIMITTKRGSKDRISVNYNNNTTFYDPLVTPRFQNTYGSEIGSYYSWGEKLSTPSTYNPLDFYQTGYNVSNSLTVSTGNDKSQTYVSLATTNAEGIIRNNDLNRYNFSIRNSTNMLGDKLNIDLGATYTKVEERNMLAQGQYFNPSLPVYLFPRGEDFAKYKAFERYNIERNMKVQYWPYGNMGLGMQNPYWITDRNEFLNTKNRYQLSSSLKWNVNDWINVTGRAKSDYTMGINEKRYSASTDGIFAGENGAYYKDDIETSQIYADLLVSMNRYVGDFSLSATVGASIQDVVYGYASLGGDLKSVANLFSLNNLNMTTAKAKQERYHDQSQSVFATAQIGWQSKVYLDLTARNDWASALARTNTPSIFYPSVGLSAIMTDLLPIQSPVLSFLKLRGSYSQVGNAPSRFITIATYPLSLGTPQTSTYLPNTDLKPELTKSWEGGLQAQFWGDKVKFNIAAYQSSTYNQLFNPTLSSTSGYNSFFVNSGRVDNKGIELLVGIKQMVGSVEWNSNLTYSLNRNKIVQLLPSYTTPSGEIVSLTEMDMGGVGNVKTILKEGGSMGDLYVTTLKRDEHGYVIVDYTSKTVTPDPNNYTLAGNSNPDYTLGWRNSLEWKGLNVAFMINARVGGVGVSMTQALMDAFGVSQTSADARDAGGALVNGSRIPAQAYYQTVGTSVGELYVYSATNVRLGELTLGYDLPVSRWNKHVKTLTLSLVGRNLLMIYNKAPYDPELTASTGTYFAGIDYFMQPSLRNVGFSVKLNF